MKNIFHIVFLLIVFYPYIVFAGPPPSAPPPSSSLIVDDEGGTYYKVGEEAEQSSDPAFLAARYMVTGSTNGHGFADNTYYRRNTGAYAAFDSLAQASGTGNDFDHFVDFQGRGIFNAGGALNTMQNMYGSYISHTINTGILSNHYGAYYADPTGTGTITTNYGTYIANQTKGATNWSVYAAGTSPSFFGGDVQFGSANHKFTLNGSHLQMLVGGNLDFVVNNDGQNSLLIDGQSNHEMNSNINKATTDEWVFKVSYTANKATSGDVRGLWINATDTSSPDGHWPFDVWVDNASKFSLDETGAIHQTDSQTHGGFVRKNYYATSGTLAGATDTIELNIPANWRILQCQLHVKTDVVDSAGNDTWSSELNDGVQEESISVGSAAAQNTNVNHWAVAETWGTLTDAETDILLTPNGGVFSSGEIEAHCLAEGFDTWDNE